MYRGRAQGGDVNSTISQTADNPDAPSGYWII